MFGIAYVAGIAWVARGLDRSVGDIVLVVVAGQRLSPYIAQSVGELGFLRGVWLDSSLRLTWLEDYAAALEEHATAAPPDALATASASSTSRSGTRAPIGCALEDVDVHAPGRLGRGVVGENGAGKSTLVKLLAGMYRPTAGRITRRRGRHRHHVDRGVAAAAWPGRSRTSSGSSSSPARASASATSRRVDDEPAVVSAVDRAGAADVVERLPAGLDTQLGPTWDDGVEVSFGQWQKLALARGFMRDEPLVLVLDEPTAALDAETEHALFERYAGAAHDANRRTAASPCSCRTASRPCAWPT